MITGSVAAVSVALAVMLIVSGAAKARRTDGTLSAMRGFGVPAVLRARWVAAALPIAELALALGLLVAPSPFSAVAAALVLALMLGFIALTARAAARGEQVDCNCFGSLSSRPVTWATVVRNVVFAVGAAVVLFGAGEGAGFASGPGVAERMLGFGTLEWLGFFAAGAVLLAATLAVVLVGGRRAPERLAPEVAPARIRDGSEWPIPDLEVTSSDGRAVPLRIVSDVRPVLLVVLSADCEPCAQVAAHLMDWQSRLAPAVGVAALTSADASYFAARYPDVDVPVYYGYRSLMKAADLGGVPSALLLGSNGMVAAGPAQGRDEILDMTAVILDAVTAAQSVTMPPGGVG
jgi:hypothetical protein